jgi:hypothetical protein
MATQTMPKDKWRALMRRLIPRATPYWRTRLEDEQDQSEWSAGFELIVWQVFQLMVFAVTLSALAQLALVVFVVPDGVPGVIGRQLAEVCQATGRCDFGYLLAGYAVALHILAAAAILIITSIARMTKLNERDRHQTDMAFLDQRFVELREELMAAGILTKPPEELPEAD